MGFGARQLFLHHYAYLLASMVPTMLITDSSSETKPQLIGLFMQENTKTVRIWCLWLSTECGHYSQIVLKGYKMFSTKSTFLWAPL